MNPDKINAFRTFSLRFLAGLSCLLLYLNSLQAQSDSLARNTEDEKPVHLPPPEHSPKKAAIFSAVLPGLGQAYNHKYWKIPVIYAAGTGLVYMLSYEQNLFTTYSTAYKQRTSGNAALVDPSLSQYTTDNLLTLKNYYNRYRDLSVIGLTMLYVLNVLDATVDAHLWHFKQQISDDLSLKIRPGLSPVFGQALPAAGLKLSLSFH